TTVTFFNSDALRINNDLSKKIEKAFFKENFRRVDYSKIGEIEESDYKVEYDEYKKGMELLLSSHMFKCVDCRIAVDMMHGIASEVFPDILNDLGIDNIMFNAHPDVNRLANINTLSKRSYDDMGSVIKALKLDVGFILYPYGQRLDIVCDEGDVLGKQDALYVVLLLLNMEAKVAGVKKRVFLPTWAADIVYFENLEVERGLYANFKIEEMKEYDLVATGDGNFAFTEFSAHRDSMFSTLKILEMIINHDVKLSKLIDSLPKFYYNMTQIDCSQALKGKMMRMFLEDAKGKKSSTLDGVKIWLDENDWILMIPDQYADKLNLYIQAKNDERGQEILATYSTKIEKWSMS
ncbi:MAG: mannose-1-phosphate guanyltransferase, partial [Sulfurovum sp.]|nr:mannose-1-phosphate guanyltransferase [Sulfurovum sp.]NNJ45161.1 mannose-1-phosphate guanyltransferase [Sulfurovum sp.]